MQVIAGHLKGRVLKSPKGSATRPTIGRMKKSIFDICAQELQDCHFLDIFAGSGQMGIEALSRGAAFATFIENAPAAISCLKSNLETFGLTHTSQLLAKPSQRSLINLIEQDVCFDIIYIDPPYGTPLTEKTLHQIDKSTLFHPQTRIFLEESQCFENKLDKLDLEHIHCIQIRKYGDTKLFEFRQKLSGY